MKKTITFFPTRAAMMLVATLLFTLTAQTAWADVGYDYIDAGGTLRNTFTDNGIPDANVTVISSSDLPTVNLGNADSETWYVVKGNIDVNNRQFVIYGTVKLILADKANLNINNSEDGLYGIYVGEDFSLTIYSQSLDGDMGSMSVSTEKRWNSINVASGSTLTICGGNISLLSTHSNSTLGIEGSVSIHNGNVNITNSSDYGIYLNSSTGSMIVHGGYVSISGSSDDPPINDRSKFSKWGGTVVCGITTEPTANTGLTYNNSAQELVVQGYCCFANIQYSTDGTNYSTDLPKATDAGTYTVYYKVVDATYPSTWEFFDPKTIEVSIAPSEEDYGALVVKKYGNKEEAILDGASDKDFDFEKLTEDELDITTVTFNRSFTKDQKTVVCWPFDVVISGLDIGKFYRFTGINGEGKIVMQEVDGDLGDLAAHTPYVFEPNKDITKIDFSSKTIKASGPQTVGTGYQFVGNYKRIYWTRDTSSPVYDTEANHKDELGRAYGFALEEITVGTTTYHKGQFVKLGSGAHTRPFRAYLLCDTELIDVTTARTRGGEGLPDVIDIVWLPAAQGSTPTGIEEVKSEKFADAWYSLDGRRLSGKPTKKGLYINNGKKVAIK